MKIKRILKIVLRVILFIILAIALLLGGIIYYNSANDYNPTEKEKLSIFGKGYLNIPEDSMVSFLSWNIGYCGLGKDMDFFYDGGKSVRPSKENFQKYLNGTLNFLARFDTVDMILLQEVDTSARRTYYTNEVKLIGQFLPNYYQAFAKNYDVRFVPVPFTSPMGNVVSGMITLSKSKPVEAFRYPYHASYSWPKNLFMLDRCLIYTKFKMPGGKDLVLINTHNSAFDDAAELREIESYIMKAIMLDEYERGNYVVVGGDWNRNPPGFDIKKLSSKVGKTTAEPKLEKDFLPQGWKWVYDPEIPTNRENIAPYLKGKTKTTIIDYFAVSPNLDVMEYKTINTDFENSDHQPVFVRVKIKADTSAKMDDTSDKDKTDIWKKKK
jgi:endonuclease/exonuclease/phosphatase family metal-dependent hydrolase